MKKLLSILLAAAMILGLCGCTIQLSTTNTIPGRPGSDDGPDGPTPYEELTLEEKMAYKTVVELVPATDYSADLLAPAQDASSGLWGYITLQGEWKVAPKYKAAGIFSGDYAVVNNNYDDCIYVNRAGEEVLSAVDKKPIRSATAFSDGMAAVSTTMDYVQKSYYVDTEGKSAITIKKLPVTRGVNYKTLQYVELASPFRDGKTVIMRTTNATLVATNEDRYPEMAYVLDSTGMVLAPLPSGMDASAAGFDDNMLVVVKNGDGLYGLASDGGALVAPCIYKSIAHCEGGMYLVQDAEGLYGYMNKSGHRVIGCIYKEAMPFSEGLAAVNDGEGWGFINDIGETVIPCEYDKVAALKTGYSGADSDKGAFSSGIALVSEGKYWGLIDQENNIIMAAEADECPVMAVYGGYISFKLNGSYGVITTEGKYVLKPGFGAIGEFR
ncbi:MAG: WG repeat-containing protein [Firmicutes bacterium]|nr:WG repeat-containing protein [Bacillota bacterium]